MKFTEIIIDEDEEILNGQNQRDYIKKFNHKKPLTHTLNMKEFLMKKQRLPKKHLEIPIQ